MWAEYIEPLWQGLFWPMLRLLLGMSVGLLMANVLEALRWTQYLARVASPLSRTAHLGEVSGAAFSTAFVSPASANALLAEKYQEGHISKREVVLSNLFNSLPSYLTHTPSIFFLVWPVLGFPTFIYVGLTLLAAFGRTVLTIITARFLLPPVPEGCVICHLDTSAVSWREAFAKAMKRFKRRIPKLCYFTVPIYALMYVLQKYGFFDMAEIWLAQHMAWLSFLRPEAMGIIALHLAAELGAALSAAGVALYGGGLSEREVVLALLVGNILSTPMRAIRHQLPSYAGFFAPRLALQLVVSNQSMRALSMLVVTVLYYYLSLPV